MQGMCVVVESSEFRWSARRDEDQQTSRWVAPPEWPKLPSSVNYLEDWDPEDPRYPNPDGWAFWRLPSGAPASGDDELRAGIDDELIEHITESVTDEAAERKSRYVATAQLRRQMKFVRALQAHEFIGSAHPAVRVAYLGVLALDRERQVLSDGRHDPRLLACCVWDRSLARLQIRLNSELFGLERMLIDGAFAADGELPFQLDTVEGRHRLRGWVMAGALDLQFQFTFDEDFPPPPFSSPEIQDEYDRQLAWVDALTTGRLPSVPAESAARADDVEWREAEQLAALALEKMGWSDAHITGGSADAGIDVVGRNVAAQVKYQSAPVGRPVLQRLIGAGRGRELACFARNGYSQQARELADEEEIALFTIELPGSIGTANAAGRRWIGAWEGDDA